MATASDLFKAGMRRLGGGVTLITSTGPDGPRGLTATAVCSVAVDPPTLLCCVNFTSSAYDTIRGTGILAVNILGERDRDLATRFSGAETRESRFTMGRWTELATGAPILETALASFDCRIIRVLDDASHSIFFAEVVAQRCGDEAPPLLYFGGSYGGFATPALTPG